MDLTDSYRRVFPPELLERYEMREVRNAAAVLQNTNPVEFDEIVEVLGRFELTREDVLTPGGSKGRVATKLDTNFREWGWREGRYDTTITSKLSLMPYRAAGEQSSRITESQVINEGYKTDNVKAGVALDVEWNAKDGNLDRDLAAFRSLYDSAIIDVGVMITRTHADLRSLGQKLGRDFLKTTTTTNLDKLEPRLTRGDSGGCPVLAIAITARCFTG